MSEENPRSKLFQLNKTVSRLAIIVPEGPHDAVQLTVGMMKRPYRDAEGGWSLLGGRVQDIDIEQAGISEIIRSLSDSQFEEITRRTAIREARNQIGLLAMLDELNYAGVFKDGQWLNALFYVLRPERPTVALKHRQPDVDGFLWDEIDAFVQSFGTAKNQGVMLRMIADQLEVEDDSVELSP